MSNSPEPLDNIIWACKECSEKLYPNKGKYKPNVGDFVKIAFKDGEKIEHMWVKITAKIEKGYVGILNNIPVHVENVIYGDEVIFKKEDVEDLHKKE